MADVWADHEQVLLLWLKQQEKWEGSGTPLVRAVRAALERMALLEGAMAAQDEREKQAGELCGVSYLENGCDWPEAVAETVLALRRQVAVLEQDKKLPRPV